MRDPADGVKGGPLGFGGPKRAPYMLFADGSVRQLNAEISSDVLQAIATPDGGEAVDLDSLAK